RSPRRSRSSFPPRPRSHRAGTAGPATPAASVAELHRLAVEVGDERHVAAAERENATVDPRVELARQLAPQAKQLAVQRLGLARREPGPRERLARLRVGDVLAGERCELRELAPAALA